METDTRSRTFVSYFVVPTRREGWACVVVDDRGARTRSLHSTHDGAIRWGEGLVGVSRAATAGGAA